jgi:TolB-like protein/Tfp pilus assembly protein PilF
MTPDIFLSYTREDQATAQRFAQGFEAQGFKVWWDVTLRSGEAYDQVTEEALRTAKAVVVLWSKKSVTSRWVRAEATLADRNRTLVPATIEPCERPIMFELTQTADLCRWTGDVKDPAWRAFLTDVRRFVETDAAPKTVAPSASAPPGPPQAARPTLAVLPFVNRSGREEDDVFADDMVEDLTAALSLSHWAKVVAASATAAYRKGARDLRQIGRDLGVRYLLEGNVRRAGQDLRVSVQLVEAETGNILWTQKFDRPLNELSDLQEDLVTELAAQLGVQVRRAEIEHARRKPGEISAYEAMMRAQAATEGASFFRWAEAVAELKRAVAIDPDYGPAYALMAAFQGRLLRHHGDDHELTQEMLQNIRRARSLDPNNPMVEGGCAAAYVSLGNLQAALRLAERAVALNPNYEPAHVALGQTLSKLGRWDEAIAHFDKVQSLGHNSIFHYFGAHATSIVQLQAGRCDEALEAADRALALSPVDEALFQSILCLAKTGSWDRACDGLRRLRETEAELSRANFENFIRDYYADTTADDFVLLARRIWDETSSEPGPA